MSSIQEQQETAGAIVERLRQAKKVLIGTHQRPDGDALGSSLALMHALALQGKEVTVFLPDPAPHYFSYLPGFDLPTTNKPNVDDYDTVVLLDYTQLHRTHLEEEVAEHPNTICIDHHLDNVGQVKTNLIVKAAATAQILYDLFTEYEIPITRDIANCLLTGIFTDTGSFMHESTSPEVLEIAADLMGKGARLSHIAQQTFQRKEVPSLRIWGRALSRVMFRKDTGISVSVVTQKDLMECGATSNDLAGVVNMLNSLPGTRMAILLTEYQPNKIKASLRSEPQQNVDVSAVARKMGGGGHKLASGFEVDGKIELTGGTWRIKQ